MGTNRIYTKIVVDLGTPGRRADALEYISRTLARHHGRVAESAAVLGVSRRTLSRILAEESSLREQVDALREAHRKRAPRR